MTTQKAPDKTIETNISSYRIHNFTQKLLQPSVVENLIAYVQWQKDLRSGKEAVPPDFAPISINLDITTACNHYCPHCIDLEFLNNGRKFTLTRIWPLIDRMVAKGLKSVIVIGGGEPTLHPQFPEIIQYLKSKKLQVGIGSNGTCMDQIEKAAPFLGEKDWVRLSLDAAKEETFSAVHASKSPRKLKEILSETKTMRSKWNGFQMGYSFLVLHDSFQAAGKNLTNNVGEIAEAARLAKEHGFSYCSVKPFICPDGSRPTEPPQGYVEEIKRQIALAKQYESDSFKVFESFNLFALFECKNETLKKQPRICHSNFFRVVVAPDGIFGCSLWRGFELVRFSPHDQDYTADYDDYFNKNRLRILNAVDAAKECAQVTCIYNDLNWFVEDLINNPEKTENLKKGTELQDYFL